MTITTTYFLSTPANKDWPDTGGVTFTDVDNMLAPNSTGTPPPGDATVVTTGVQPSYSYFFYLSDLANFGADPMKVRVKDIRFTLLDTTVFTGGFSHWFMDHGIYRFNTSTNNVNGSPLPNDVGSITRTSNTANEDIVLSPFGEIDWSSIMVGSYIDPVIWQLSDPTARWVFWFRVGTDHVSAAAHTFTMQGIKAEIDWDPIATVTQPPGSLTMMGCGR